MQFEFLVQGSQPEPYLVRIRKYGEVMIATCNCKAGIIGQYCKHRVQLLKGKADALVGGAEHTEALRSCIAGSALEHALLEYEEAEKTYKKEVDAAKKKKQEAGKKLSHALEGR